MPVNTTSYTKLAEELPREHVTLVAVSKLKPPADILTLYNLGQRDFGENYVQELTVKWEVLPKDIRWHFVGHLQSNKVKLIAPFVHLVHGIDSARLLAEVNRQGAKVNRVIPVLLQVHIAAEETKFGLDAEELEAVLRQVSEQPMSNVLIRGFMGMASFSDRTEQVAKEFEILHTLFQKHQAQKNPSIDLQVLSMGMSNDYTLAIQNGSNMVRIGSLLFGARG